MTDNVFSGENAVLDFLNPDNHPPLPLVELPLSLNPYKSKRIRIFVKLMHFLPLANVKSLPAYNMLEQAREAGELSDVHSMVESSSGNTVFSLAVIGRAFGIPKTLALASNQVEPGKLQLLRFLGTDVRIVEEDICPDPTDPGSAINQAHRLGQESGWCNPGQYSNAANPGAHERWTGPQIWSQTQGQIGVLVAGLGTTGTLCGTSGYLKSQQPSLRTVGVIREPNNPVPGVRTKTLLGAVDFNWRDYADRLVSVGTREAYRTSLGLCRSGIMAGPSSGFALAGALKYFARAGADELDELRNDEGDLVAVVIAPDSPFPYIEEYFRYLGEELFPQIENKELLGRPARDDIPAAESSVYDVDITPYDLLKAAYTIPVDGLMAVSGERQETPVASPYIIIDVRSKREFDDHHLPGSDRIDCDKLFEYLESVFVPAFRRKGIRPIFVCAYGGKSSLLARRARSFGIEAFSLQGGTMEWSSLGLPRIKGAECLN